MYKPIPISEDKTTPRPEGTVRYYGLGNAIGSALTRARLWNDSFFIDVPEADIPHDGEITLGVSLKTEPVGRLTEFDLNLVRYFIEKDGNLEGWVGFEEKRPLLERDAPELMRALASLEDAKKNVKRALEHIHEIPHDND